MKMNIDEEVNDEEENEENEKTIENRTQKNTKSSPGVENSRVESGKLCAYYSA